MKCAIQKAKQSNEICDYLIENSDLRSSILFSYHWILFVTYRLKSSLSKYTVHVANYLVCAVVPILFLQLQCITYAGADQTQKSLLRNQCITLQEIARLRPTSRRTDKGKRTSSASFLSSTERTSERDFLTLKLTTTIVIQKRSQMGVL